MSERPFAPSYERLGFRIVAEDERAYDMQYGGGREADVEQGTSQYWFPVKRYGWGWGLPCRWQGWVALALYFASIYAGIRYFHPRDNVAGFLVWLAIATILFVVVVAWKGERPLAWRWGD